MEHMQHPSAQDYEAFLASKKPLATHVGKVIDKSQIHPLLHDFQRDTVALGVKMGRFALFLDTGLGKTRTATEAARLLGGRWLTLAPLSVAEQTIAETARIDVETRYIRSPREISEDCWSYITNYEMAHHFNPADFNGVILDESSILKALDSKTRLQLTEQWKHTRYRICATATPAPNDLKEIVNHAQFLGVMSRKEVFATFFINDGGKELHTRLKAKAVKDFYGWMASWAIAMKRPSDLGYDDHGYALPDLVTHFHPVPTNYTPKGMLMHVKLSGVTDRSKVQRETLEARCRITADLVNNSTERWLVWHHLNDEGYLLRDLIPVAVLVEGAQDAETKAAGLRAFADGSARVLITKPEIAGFGLNFQSSHHQVWAGINDSFEQLYQGIRRQYRYGQTQPVQVHLVYADAQETVLENVLRKQEEASHMTEQLVNAMKEDETSALRGLQSGSDYQTAEHSGTHYRLLMGDSVERLKELADESVHLSVFSPPFVNRYAYTATERDLGNSGNLDQFMQHFDYIIKELYRVTLTGRNVCVHCQQVRTTKRDTGEVGLIDFRGAIITAFVRAGFVYYADYTVDKDAQVQARRKHHQALLYKTKDTDSSKSGSALADYLLVFKKPGTNPIPIKNDIPNHIWNNWARPVWYDIDETAVLPTQMASDDDDEMHLCPLQRPFIERCVRLWSNIGETVLDPFSGVGSTGYEALRWKRHYVGIELKPSYYRTSLTNLDAAEALWNQKDLFEFSGVTVDE